MRHGEGRRNHKSAEYRIWASMRQRCADPNHAGYPRYGARGVTVCERWQTFENFLADMGRRPSSDHSIDRIDNNGSYGPSNCRWATRDEQNRNKRNNIWITVHGVRAIVNDHARKYGIDRRIVTRRLRDGWDEERAVLEPSSPRSRFTTIVCKRGHRLARQSDRSTTCKQCKVINQRARHAGKAGRS